MFKKKDKRLGQGGEESNRGFTGNVPTGQSRKIISPFVDRQKGSDSARRLDDFQRGEGYQSFTPRSVGMPMSENDPTFGTDNLGSQTGSAEESHKRKSHRLFGLFRHLF